MPFLLRAPACNIGKQQGLSQLSCYSMMTVRRSLQGLMYGMRLPAATQVRTETANVDLDVILTGSSGAFNVTMPGMSVVCYELQISGNVQSKPTVVQAHTRA